MKTELKINLWSEEWPRQLGEEINLEPVKESLNHLNHIIFIILNNDSKLLSMDEITVNEWKEKNTV